MPLYDCGAPDCATCIAEFRPSDAQAGEARRAETGTGSVHEHAVGAADAPIPYSGPDRRNLRGPHDPVRSLAEAFPEFYRALVMMTDLAGWTPANMNRHADIAFARSVLSRMEGRKECAISSSGWDDAADLMREAPRAEGGVR